MCSLPYSPAPEAASQMQCTAVSPCSPPCRKPEHRLSPIQLRSLQYTGRMELVTDQSLLQISGMFHNDCGIFASFSSKNSEPEAVPKGPPNSISLRSLHNLCKPLQASKTASGYRCNWTPVECFSKQTCSDSAVIMPPTLYPGKNGNGNV